MCLKLWPSRVLYFIKEWSLCFNFISLPSYISRDAVGVGRSPKTGNVALDKVCCPRTGSQFPVTGERLRREAVSGNKAGWMWFLITDLGVGCGLVSWCYTTQNGSLPTQASWHGNRKGILPTTSLLVKKTLKKVSFCCFCFVIFILYFSLLFKA